MAANKRTKTQIRKDRAEIARLYLQGETQAAIGKKLGLVQQQIGYDLKAIRKEWLKSSLIDFNEAKARELAKIDNLEITCWQAWDRSNKAKRTETTTVRGEDEETISITIKEEQLTGDKRFLDGVDSCIDKRIKIFGFAAPVKRELSGPDGGPIRTEDVSITEEERINRISAIFERARERRDKMAPFAAIG